MSADSEREDGDWAAEKRTFVADRRDDLADERDAAADARDRIADAREAELDRWERRLDACHHASTADGEVIHTLQAHHAARVARDQARHDRDQADADRADATDDRHRAATLREADTSPTRLAMAFAEIAERLFSSEDADEVFTRIAETAVATIAGCDMATVSLRGSRGYRTAASTHPAATAVDAAQYDTDEGPCLDALEAPMVSAESFPDARWPELAGRPTESGVQSALSYQLRTAAASADTAGDGSLNSYGTVPAAFDDTAKEIGLILAAHASVAARAVGKRCQLERTGDNLQQALLSRDVIGQAKGILMERLKITPDDAFDLLRRASQHLNMKLRELARDLTETGQFPATQPDGPGGPGGRGNASTSPS